MYLIMNFFNTFAGDLAEKCSEKKQLVYNPLPHWILEMAKKSLQTKTAKQTNNQKCQRNKNNKKS